LIVKKSIHKKWARFWLKYSGLNPMGRFATNLATLFSPPYKARTYLARLSRKGYISPKASIFHSDFRIGNHVFIGDRIIVYQSKGSGTVTIGDRSYLHHGTIIETGFGGNLKIGSDTHIQPRCQFSAYLGSIIIGSGVEVAPNCAFYPYNHSLNSDKTIENHPLQTKGGIFIDDGAWLGFGVIVLDGVKIGKRAVIGAGSVVNQNIPGGAVAAGVPARVLSTADSD
jgi:acetyltransferase-like isoleucine patch superfamily enzyme